MKTKHLNHSTYKIQYHIVWGTKYRRPWLTDYVKAALIENLYQTCKKYPTLFIHIVNTDKDHVHIQIEIPPNIAVWPRPEITVRRAMGFVNTGNSPACACCAGSIMRVVAASNFTGPAVRLPH